MVCFFGGRGGVGPDSKKNLLGLICISLYLYLHMSKQKNSDWGQIRGAVCLVRDYHTRSRVALVESPDCENFSCHQTPEHPSMDHISAIREHEASRIDDTAVRVVLAW